MNSRNFALNSRALDRIGHARAEGDVMTISGAITKTLILTLALTVSAGYTWWKYAQGGSSAIAGAMTIGVLGGLVVAILTIFKPHFSPWSAPLYAVLEGIAIGGVSATYSDAKFSYHGMQGYPGMAMQAAALTFAVLLVMAALYYFRVVRVTARTRSILLSMMLAICAYYLISLVATLFGTTLPLVYSNGPFGIAFSLLVVAVASWSLLLDFDAMEQAQQAGAPKYYEWYTAFGLLVGLVWLYLEMIRLLSKLRGSRN